ncbi:hypothetical protein Tco_0637528 [Tanacetum coccineum]
MVKVIEKTLHKIRIIRSLDDMLVERIQRYVHARLGIQDHAIVGFMAARYMNETGRAEADGDEQSDSEKMKIFAAVAVMLLLHFRDGVGPFCFKAENLKRYEGNDMKSLKSFYQSLNAGNAITKWELI